MFDRYKIKYFAKIMI